MSHLNLILAIESSCDETACCILSPTSICSEIVYTQMEHAAFGGVVPEVAARDHQVRLPNMIKKVIEQAGCAVSDLCEISYTHGPGLAGCLLVGHYYSLGLSSALKIPLRGIHHLEGHIMSVLIDGEYGDGISWREKFLQKLPCVVLIVSGGHTLFVEVRERHYSILGETRDDAVGEIFDKIARLMGLPYPGGALLSKMASQGAPLYQLPLPMVDSHTADMSFSGLKTAARLLYQKLGLMDVAAQNKLGDVLYNQRRCDFAASFEHAIVTTLISKLKFVMKQTGLKTFMLAGGVSANAPLRRSLSTWCEENEISCILPDVAYSGDNASMIGVAAWVRREMLEPCPPAELCLRTDLKW